MTRQDQSTYERIRNRIKGFLEEKPPPVTGNPKRYRFLRQENYAPEYKKVTFNVTVTLATYHRIAETMQRLQCGLSQAVEAMLENVEAHKVTPLERNWKGKYQTKKKRLWQSFDLHGRSKIRINQWNRKK